MKLDLRDFVEKGLKFAVVGVVGVGVNLGVLFILVQYFWGVSHYLEADLVAIAVAFGSNYVGNILVGNIRVKGVNAPKDGN